MNGTTQGVTSAAALLAKMRVIIEAIEIKMNALANKKNNHSSKLEVSIVAEVTVRPILEISALKSPV